MNAPRHVNAPGLAKPAGHYSHATVANGFVFVAGQLPVRPDGSRMGDESSFEEQARQVLANVRAVLQAAGSDVEKLVQVRVYVDDIANWPGFNAIYGEWAGAARPARCVVPTGELHHGVKLEVEAMALA